MKTEVEILTEALSDVKPDSNLERLRFVLMTYILLSVVVLGTLSLLMLLRML